MGSETDHQPSASDVTSWSMIQGAARGDSMDRSAFARRYEAVVRAYFGARWRNTVHLRSLDDAVQEVFLDCFKEDGALERVVENRQSSFRAFLFGVVRNVALRHEDHRRRNRERPAGTESDLEEIPLDETRLSQAFDRAWARERVREAVARQKQLALRQGAKAVRRVELLRRRFYEGLPIREIAREWQEDPAHLHHQYAHARREFREALVQVMSAHHPGPPEEIERECVFLIGLLRP